VLASVAAAMASFQVEFSRKDGIALRVIIEIFAFDQWLHPLILFFNGRMFLSMDDSSWIIV